MINFDANKNLILLNNPRSGFRVQGLGLGLKGLGVRY